MDRRLIKIAMNSRYGISKPIGRGLINNYRKMHGLPLFRKKNKKKRRYSRYPRYELYKTMMQLNHCVCVKFAVGRMQRLGKIFIFTRVYATHVIQM
jgi:hypothetical protein